MQFWDLAALMSVMIVAENFSRSVGESIGTAKGREYTGKVDPWLCIPALGRNKLIMRHSNVKCNL